MDTLTVPVLALFVVSASCVVGAHAAAPDAVAEVRLEFNRQALNEPARAEQFYRQVRQAAAKVCSMANSRSGDLQHFARWEVCYRHTLHDAITTIDAPVLLALYDGSSRHRPG